MSYNVDIRSRSCAHCGRSDHLTECGNYTYNVTPMLVKAMGRKGLYEIDGVPTPDAAERIALALSVMESDQASFRDMNPANGWGDFYSCRDWLHQILKRCREFPDGVVVIS